MLAFAIDIARRAGALLREGLAQQPQIELKSTFEVVTNMDRASEALIVGVIRRQFPDHAILSEEGGGVAQDSPFLWLIDPLDGTNNYAHGFPFFSVSLALVHDQRLALGVIYDPLRDELFAAEAGRGATLNQQPISVAPTPALTAALVSTGFPYDFATSQANNAGEFSRIQALVQGVRRSGSAALDLAYVAAGRLDAHWELRLKPWDSAAGALLVSEAGGAVSGWRGEPWTPWSETLLVSNGHIHAALLAVLSANPIESR